MLALGCGEKSTSEVDTDTALDDSSGQETDAGQTADAPSDSAVQDTLVKPQDGASDDVADTIDGKTPPQVDVQPLDPYAVATLLKHWFDDYNKGTDQSYLTAKYELLADGSPEHPDALPHEAHLDVSYGPFTRNKLDFYRAKGVEGPTPVAVYIHGGGYIGGDKSQIHQPVTTLDRFLKAGISVASVNYRWAYKDPVKALQAPKPNDIGEVHDENGTRLDFILRDCARAIQFLRYKAADWGIDKSRIGAYGGSAGAGCAMWIATIPDLANPKASDPVLKESTQLVVVGHTNSQVTMNFPAWPELLDMPKDFVFEMVGPKAQSLGQMTLDDQVETVEGKQLCSILDYYAQLGPEGPALYVQNSKPDSDETEIESSGDVIHHPRGGVALYERCVDMGLECVIKTQIIDSGYQGDVVTFMMEQLTKP